MRIGVGIFFLVLGCVGALYVLVSGAITYSKAKREGILKFRFPAKVLIMYFIFLILFLGVRALDSAAAAGKAQQVLAEAQTRGADAFLRAEDDRASVILDEERFIERKTLYYQKKAEEEQGNAYGFLGEMLLWSSLLVLNLGFVTEKGYYAMTARKPRRLLPEEKDGFLLLFTERSAGTDKPLLRVPDTLENREKYAVLLNKDETNEEETGIYFA